MKIQHTTIAALVLLAFSKTLVAAQEKNKSYNLSQNDSMRNVFMDGRAKFFDERLNQAFPLLGLRKTIHNEVYDFDKTGRCMMIEFGFSNCAPCRVQLPGFLALSNDRQYANVDFIYISYDDSATIMKDITTLYHGPYNHVKILSIDRSYFFDRNNPTLTYGFPTTYFIDDNRIVKSIKIGGRPEASKSVKEELMNTWTSQLDSLSCF